VRGGTTTTYACDGWGNLIRETVNGLTTDFVLDEGSSLPRVLGTVRSDSTETLYPYVSLMLNWPSSRREEG
jgi:hypothetical protein